MALARAARGRALSPIDGNLGMLPIPGASPEFENLEVLGIKYLCLHF